MKHVYVACVAFLLLTGCAMQIADIKNEDHVGEDVVVTGTVINTIKIGSLSGYRLQDDAGDTIGVSTNRLPQEGDEVRVKGVLLKDTLFGYYIKAE